MVDPNERSTLETVTRVVDHGVGTVGNVIRYIPNRLMCGSLGDSPTRAGRD